MSTLDPRDVMGVDPAAMPKHVAIIMDGNGRWAQARDLPRIEGHRNASVAVRETVTHCARLDLQCLTLYSFSLENWKRPRMEVEGLMTLYADYLSSERQLIMDNNIRLVQLGQREGLPKPVIRELDMTQQMSRTNTGMTLCLALNYGARAEIVAAAQSLARRAQSGEITPEQIDERLFSESLGTAGLPDPDLLIRTAGEMRISNFLLWQISYAELYVTPVLWPEFRSEHLYDAIRAYARRERRFGDLHVPVERADEAGKTVPTDSRG